MLDPIALHPEPYVEAEPEDILDLVTEEPLPLVPVMNTDATAEGRGNTWPVVLKLNPRNSLGKPLSLNK